jgi:hypothetical protein
MMMASSGKEGTGEVVSVEKHEVAQVLEMIP